MNETEQDPQATETATTEVEAVPETDWQAEAEKFRNDYLRSLADMENLRKRTEKQIGRASCRERV